MKVTNPKTPNGLSDLEARISVRAETGDILATGVETEQDSLLHTGDGHSIVNLRLLWESRRFLARCAGIGLVLTAVLTLFISNRYQSVAQLMPPDNQSSSGLAMTASALAGGAGALGGIASQLIGLKSNSDLLAGILASNSAKDKLIQQFDLEKLYNVHRIEDARKVLEQRTEISVDRKSQIITISVSDQCHLGWGCESPARAQKMAQAYVDELNYLLAELSTSSAKRERIFLEGRLKSVNQDLEAAEKEFSLYASKNTAIDIKEQGRAMVDAAATLQGQFIAAESELEGLRQIYADTNIRVRTMQARVAELQDQLRKVGGADDTSSSGTGSAGNPLYPSIRQLPLLGVEYGDLYRKTKVEEAIFETLTQEYELAKVQEAKEIPTVKLLDPPSLPEKKAFPPRTLITLLGATLALACGVSWVLGCTKWKQIDSHDPGKVLAQEIYHTIKSSIPWVSRNGFQHEPESKTENPKVNDSGRKSANED